MIKPSTVIKTNIESDLDGGVIKLYAGTIPVNADDANDHPKWQPIETAPMDGTVVIVWPPTFRGVVSCARFDSNKNAKRPRPYWRRIDTDSISISRENHPTHWLPVLPGPLL